MKVGVIGAMEKEASLIQEQLANKKEETIAGMRFVLGTLGNHEVICVQSGVGKVNAGVCASLLIDHYKVEALINTGIAGSLNNDLHIGDVVISKDACYHDVNATVFGYSEGEIPGMKTLAFEGDKDLIQKIKKCIDEHVQDIHCLIGRVVSGDQFISDAKVKEEIKETFHGDCCEMEGAAIAQTAYLFKTPFVILRFISDQADGSDVKDYIEFESEAAEHSAAILIEVLKNL